MAVPKKRTSKSKKNIRKNVWKKKVEKHVVRSLFLAREALKNKSETQVDITQNTPSGPQDGAVSSVSQ